MSLQDLLDYLRSLLRPELFSDHCPNGLQIQGKEAVSRVATAVTACKKTIEKALDEGCDALIVHHGLFWNGEGYEIVGIKYEKIKLLIDNGCSLLAYHLPLDAHREVGNNWRAAKEMEWKNLQPFGEIDGIAIGVKGEIEPQSVETFKNRIEKYYAHPAHCALGGPKEVSSAALISGGAYRSIKEAAENGVDCFITGNFDEPAWHLAHELGVNFFALGHSATERVGPRALAEAIRENFSIDTRYLSDENPF